MLYPENQSIGLRFTCCMYGMELQKNPSLRQRTGRPNPDSSYPPKPRCEPWMRWPMDQLPLPLFVAGILTHNEDNAPPPDNLAAFANAFDAGANLHGAKITFLD